MRRGQNAGIHWQLPLVAQVYVHLSRRSFSSVTGEIPEVHFQLRYDNTETEEKASLKTGSLSLTQHEGRESVFHSPRKLPPAGRPSGL